MAPVAIGFGSTLGALGARRFAPSGVPPSRGDEPMLGDKRVATTIPVRDTAEARNFYEGTLGLKFTRELADGSTEYECGGGTSVYTYPTEENAGQSPATLASFEVDDAEATVSEMRNKGITFEEYDMPGLKTEDGVAEVAGSKGGWFKDPDGNILAVFEPPRA
jgi:catechol 2,3-dioxygenase-like lactoylglutathione lyase family enzyme